MFRTSIPLTRGGWYCVTNKNIEALAFYFAWQRTNEAFHHMAKWPKCFVMESLALANVKNEVVYFEDRPETVLAFAPGPGSRRSSLCRSMLDPINCSPRQQTARRQGSCISIQKAMPRIPQREFALPSWPHATALFT